MQWLKNPIDTCIILSLILGSTLWMNYRFNKIQANLEKIILNIRMGKGK